MPNRPLIAARKARGLSKRELARRVGVSEGTIRNLESGRLPKLRDARAIATVLRCRIEDLWPQEAA